MGQVTRHTTPFISVAEYLEGETLTDTRHEYFDGEVTAMAGASDWHERVSLDLATDLNVFLEGKPCKVFKGDLKLRLKINLADVFFYPDLMVTCDPADNHKYFREHPTVLIEILSEDTRKDLMEKYLIYQTISSLQEYIVLGQDPAEPIAYVHRRSTGWKQEIVREGDALTIPSLEFSMPLLRAYRGLL
jgi:Uma2 family endonuclease